MSKEKHKVDYGVDAPGVDAWSTVNLSGNTSERTSRNAEIEGAKEKVEVLSGDATAMKFTDGTFDVVLSNLVIHNIPTREGWDKACREISSGAEAGWSPHNFGFREDAPVPSGV